MALVDYLRRLLQQQKHHHPISKLKMALFDYLGRPVPSSGEKEDDKGTFEVPVETDVNLGSIGEKEDDKGTFEAPVKTDVNLDSIVRNYIINTYTSSPEFKTKIANRRFERALVEDQNSVMNLALLYHAKEIGKDVLKAAAIFVVAGSLGAAAGDGLEAIPNNLVPNFSGGYYDVGKDLSDIIKPVVAGSTQWFAAHKVFGEKEGKSKKVFEFLLKWNAISAGIDAVSAVGSSIYKYGTDFAGYEFPQTTGGVPKLITSSLNGVNTVFSTVTDKFPSMIVAGLSTAKFSVMDLYERARAKIKTFPGRDLLIGAAQAGAVIAGTYFATEIADTTLTALSDRVVNILPLAITETSGHLPTIKEYLPEIVSPLIGASAGLFASNKFFSGKQGAHNTAFEFLTKWYAIHVGVGAFGAIASTSNEVVKGGLEALTGDNAPNFINSISTVAKSFTGSVTSAVGWFNNHYVSGALAAAYTAGKRFPDMWAKAKQYAAKAYNFVKEPLKPVIGGVLGYMIPSYIAKELGADQDTANKIGEYMAVASTYFTANLVKSRAWRLAAKAGALLYGGQVIGSTEAIMDNFINPVDNYFGGNGIADGVLRYGSQIGVLAGIKSAYNRTIGKAFGKGTPMPQAQGQSVPA